MATKNIRGVGDDGKSLITGVFRARIENNKDPMKLGRVQVRVPQLHGIPETGLKISSLPWAHPVTPAGSGYQHGSIMIPDIGDYVFIMFENGDRNSPIYFGGCYGRSNNSKPYGKLDNEHANSDLYNGGGWRPPA